MSTNPPSSTMSTTPRRDSHPITSPPSPSSAADTQISHPSQLTYWNDTPATVSGMLGGYPTTISIDLRGSLKFLRNLIISTGSQVTLPLARAVDCGAGIGRVTSGFLSKVCSIIDIVEPTQKFAEVAGKLGGWDMKGDGRIGEVFVTGLESWKPEEMYDLVWIQWCIGHLTDSQTVEFLGRCKENLQEMGWIVIKENLSSLSEDMFDELDSSVTRTDGKFKSLFASAELRVVREEVQKGFPPELLRVKIYALVRV